MTYFIYEETGSAGLSNWSCATQPQSDSMRIRSTWPQSLSSQQHCQVGPCQQNFLDASLGLHWASSPDPNQESPKQSVALPDLPPAPTPTRSALELTSQKPRTRQGNSRSLGSGRLRGGCVSSESLQPAVEKFCLSTTCGERGQCLQVSVRLVAGLALIPSSMVSL